MKSSRQLRTKLTAIVLGLLGTLAASLGFYTGVWDRFERLATDFRFRHFNRTIQDSGQVAMVVIDDEALAGIGDWPWPRTHLAKIINLLNELESRQILIDLVFSMPKSGNSGEKTVGADMREDENLGEDDALAQACREQGQVVLSTYFTEQPARTPVYDLLLTDLTQRSDVLATRAKLPLRQVERDYLAMRRQAARQRVMDVLTVDSELGRDDVAAKILGPTGSFRKDQVQEIEQAYDYIQSYLHIRDKLGWVIEEKNLPAPIHVMGADRQMVLPIAKLATSCADVGFVDFDRDPEGKVREMSLLKYYDGRIYRHLTMTGLCEYLQVQPVDFRMGPATVELTGGRTGEGKSLVLTADAKPGIHIPMTRAGKMIIDWYAPAGKEHYWEKDSPNVVSAARLLTIALNQEALRQNRQLLADALAITVENFLPDQYDRYQKLTRRLAMLHEGVRDAVPAPAATAPATAPASRPASQPTTSTAPATLEQDLVMNYQETKAQVDKIEKEAKSQLRWLYEQLPDLTPREQAEGKNPLIRGLWRCLYRPREVRRINAQLEANIEQKIAEVAPIVRGKMVLIGYTATTSGDFVSTPVFPHTPGVVVHANILNQVLQGAFLSESDRNGDLLVILVLGTMATLLATQRSEFEGLLWMLVLLSGFFFFTCEVIFERLHIVSSLVGPMVAIVLSWSLVSFYRRLTEGRAKRAFAGRLSQYTSPALARRIADDPEGQALVPEDRKISCFFSDIAGFTPLSEKLGPAQTVELLNIYLEHASEVLDGHEAFINKFLGDGIFAFFNPPLHAQEDHARRACLAAVETLEALPHIQEHLQEAIPGMTRPLAIRIGISTGPAVVGDCGSKRKFDYTCLGDTVNLASRMEAANKFFGTRIMICQVTHEEMGEDLLARPLGKIRVVGREQPVVVYELIGMRDEHADRAEFAAGFGDMVTEYWAGRFEKAASILDELEKRDPDDKPAKIYRGLLDKIRTSGKQVYRDGVIELETK